jgi:mono/diheme cytochrome c family protein
MSDKIWCLGWGIALAGLLACGGQEQAPPPPATPAARPAAAPKPAGPPPDEQAATIFATRCYTCHGKEGGGDGPGSAGLVPPPRDFRDADWQGSVSDEHISQIILYGGMAVGKSPTMPPNPDLNSKPDVVAALVRYIRALPN